MYFVSVSWKHKREEVKRVSQLSVFSVYRKTKGGSSCFSNLWQKREQKRWNGRSTPGNCVCSSHCVSFVVAQKIHIHKEVGDSFSSLQYYVILMFLILQVLTDFVVIKTVVTLFFCKKWNREIDAHRGHDLYRAQWKLWPSLSCNFCLKNERGPSSLRNKLASLIRGDDATQPITSCHECLTAKISRFHHHVENTLEITANPKHLPKEKQILHFSTIKAKSTSRYLQIFWDHHNSKAGNSDHSWSPGDNEAFWNINKSTHVTVIVL